jgi:hypothetical protein
VRNPKLYAAPRRGYELGSGHCVIVVAGRLENETMSEDDIRDLVDTDIGLGLAFVALAKMLEDRGVLKMAELGAHLLTFAETSEEMKKNRGTGQILHALANQLLTPRSPGPPKFTILSGGKPDKED